ncbi:MAG: gamma-glutamyl-gamma-aminobutyrate hydrolase family protein, partial [Acidimicrobiia bacterium]
GAAAARLARFDGLMLPGGGDIDPGEYGEEAHPEVAFVNLARDRFEIPLIRVAVATSLPTLAICRGYQVLNVAFGGTLDQHINEREGLVAHRSDNGKEGVLHPVRIEPGCRLAKAVGTELDEAFSHHHQALGRLGTGLSVVAWAPDGIAEAVEFSTGGWVVGIQWHAEATAAADPAQQAIFDAFVEQVSSPRSTG